MALFAPVAPAPLLREIKGQWGEDSLGYYHLVLAHDIIENKEAWRGLLPPGSTVIIDNSVIELGIAVAMKTVMEAYHFFREEKAGYKLVLVPPETLDDAIRTFFDFKEGWEWLKALGEESGEFELMYVVQGKSTSEIDESFELLNIIHSQSIPVNWIGIPRRLVDNVGTRAYATAKVLQHKLVWGLSRGLDIKVHLLGFSNNIQDDIYCTRLPWIFGIDSAVPLRLGQKGAQINLAYKGDQAGPRNDFWTKPGKLERDTWYNLETFRHVIRSKNTYASNYTPRLHVSNNQGQSQS